jgi:rhamnosyltransferase
MYKARILMSTYNGEKYLKEQIESLLNQKGVDVSILVRDDGSTDSTLDILEQYRKDGKVEWYSGKNLKSALSFIDLLFATSTDFDFYAFCDQDDVWLDNKLAISFENLSWINERPALTYCGAYITDTKLSIIGEFYYEGELATDFKKNIFCFGIEQGCCMVFNNELLKVAKQYRPQFVTMHDAWLHKICLLHDGIVIPINQKLILYRQHNDNVIGIKKKRKVSHLFDYTCSFSKMYCEMLDKYEEADYEKRKHLSLIANYKTSLIAKFRLMCFSLPKELGIKKRRIFKIKVLLGTL